MKEKVKKLVVVLGATVAGLFVVKKVLDLLFIPEDYEEYEE